MNPGAAAVERVDQFTLQPVPAGLEAVGVVDEIEIGDHLPRALESQIARKRLRVRGERSGPFQGERRVAHSDFDGSILGLGTDIPVEVLHAAHDAEVAHL